MSHWIPELSVAAIRPLAERSAREVLAGQLEAAIVDSVLESAWSRYQSLDSGLPDEPTLGAGVMVHLSAWIAGLFLALQDAGLSEDDAVEWTATVVWPVYAKIASPAWKVAGLGAKTPIERAQRTMDLFFRFPYASPGYEVEPVETEAGSFGFDIRRCPMADFFASQGLSKLCQRACCDLDFPLAESWGTRLEVAQTISRGADRCTFRFHPRDDPAEST